MNPSSTAKTILFWLSIVLLGVMLWKLVSANGQAAREDEPSYSEFMAHVDSGDVKEVTMYLSPNSYELQGEYAKANKKFHVTVFKEAAPDLTKLTLSQAYTQWAQARRALGRWFGQAPLIGRPPSGAVNRTVRAAAYQGGLKYLVGWSARADRNRIRTWNGKDLRPGEIVLMSWTRTWATN